MKIKIITLSICTFLIITALPVNSKDKNLFQEQTIFLDSDSLKGGWLEDKNGVTILHVNGSYYDMGYQHGFYLQDEIKENIRALKNYCEIHGWGYDKVLEVWKIQQNYLPQIYTEEIQGMADGMNVTFEEVAVHNTWMGVFNHLFSCWGAALWGDATIDGNLVHMRSCDGVNTILDPLTGAYLYENQVVIVRNPDDAYASISPIFSGDIISIGGFNEMGIGISELTIIAYDTTFHGINAGFRMRMVLDFAENAYEAVDIMNSNRTCCWNFIISDGTIPTGFAIEQSANYAYANTWFDHVEGIEPFWKIKDVVRRGNCYINPILAGFERNSYNPSGLMGYIRMFFGIDYTFINWIQYKALSNEIERMYGSLDLDETMSLLRNVYNGNTNLLFRRFLTDKSDTGRQWVGCPITGDFLVCFAENSIEAYKNPVHSLNFFDLLNNCPP